MCVLSRQCPVSRSRVMSSVLPISRNIVSVARIPGLCRSAFVPEICLLYFFKPIDSLMHYECKHYFVLLYKSLRTRLFERDNVAFYPCFVML